MIIIGERVNATRRDIGEAIRSRNYEIIEEEIRKQDLAGAHYIDLNASTGTGDIDQEIDDLKWLIDVALESTEKGFALDTADLVAMKEGAEYLGGRRPWIMNSIKGTKDTMEKLFPIVIEHKVPFIALAMDSTGIPKDATSRINICRKICEQSSKIGIPEENIFFDPLVLPISSDISQGEVTLETLRGIGEFLPKSKTTIGLSNISYGLPKRSLINHAFLMATISNGLNSVICDPTEKEISRGILLGELISGRDRHCRRFTRTLREGKF